MSSIYIFFLILEIRMAKLLLSLCLQTPTPRKLKIIDYFIDSNCLATNGYFFENWLTLLFFFRMNLGPMLAFRFDWYLVWIVSSILRGVGIS